MNSEKIRQGIEGKTDEIKKYQLNKFPIES